MEKLVNGDSVVQAILMSKLASKIGFSLVFVRRMGRIIVAYVIHKNKHYALSLKTKMADSCSTFPLEAYVAISIARTINPKNILFVFERNAKISKLIKTLSHNQDYNYSISFQEQLSSGLKATCVLESLLMNAQDDFFLKGLCELGISLRSTDEELRAEIYKILDLHTLHDYKYFLDLDAYTKKRDLKKYLASNIPLLDVYESIIFEDYEFRMDGIDILNEQKIDITCVDTSDDLERIHVPATLLNKKATLNEETETIEGSVDL